MDLALGDDATQRVVAVLRRRVLDTVPLLITPDEFVRDGWGTDDTIAFELGHYPECIARVWNKLAEGLPDSAVVLVSATPALVDPATGRLVAFVSGMTYMVRVPESQRAAALALGYQNEFTGCWPDERDEPPDLGQEWVEGRWEAVELLWVRTFIPSASSGGRTRRGT